MHFHLPKPIHGWREFLGEIAIIVVGVLIALGAEQVVETFHLRRETDEAMGGVRAELGLDAGVFEERAAVQPCLDRRLEELGVLISRARQSHQLPDIGEIGRPPIRPIQATAWTSATSRGLVGKFPEAERNTLQAHYSQSATYSADVQNEQETWATLRMLEHQPGNIDSSLLADAVITLERLRFQSWLNGLNANQLFASIRPLGVATSYEILVEPGQRIDRATLLQRVQARPVCGPLLVNDKPFEPQGPGRPIHS